MTGDYDTGFFGQNVREYRKLYNWQPFQLARKCLTGTEFLLDIENGKAPDASLIWRISKVFNVSVDKLLAPPKKNVAKIMSEEEKEHLEFIAETFAGPYNLNKDAILAGPRDSRIQNGVLKTPLESIDFDLIDEKKRNDVAKTVYALRELGFSVGIGEKYGKHSVKIDQLTLNISHKPKYRQMTDPPANEDDLMNYILNAASGEEMDYILNRKHRVKLNRETKEKIRKYCDKRGKELSDLSWVELNE